MELLIKVFLAAAIIVSGAVGFAYSGVYNVSAMERHSPLMNWLLHTTMRASIGRRADQGIVPDLGDEALRNAGVNDYAAMCAGCHGAPGQPPEPMGLGMNPRPPDLAESARSLSDEEIFWVTKHGVRMTGMPAWGATHDDDSIWPVVAFVRSLPDLGAASYREWLSRAAGAGHHLPNESAERTHGGDRNHGHDPHDH